MEAKQRPRSPRSTYTNKGKGRESLGRRWKLQISLGSTKLEQFNKRTTESIVASNSLWLAKRVALARAR
eukprot:7020560-Prorocentrum_lima.AAC.1